MTVPLDVTTWLVLRRGARRLDVRTRVRNRARDHRLRVLLPTGLGADRSWAESAFAVEARPIAWPDTGDNMEGPYPTKPMQNFLDVSDGGTGLAILGRGLREYEVMDDPERTIALTLLRTTRAYMVANEDMTAEERARHAGPHVLGDLAFRYAILPHRGTWREGRVLPEAYAHKVPMRILQGVRNEGDLPPRASLLSLEPAGEILASALKRAEDGPGIVLRLWNPRDEALRARIRLGLPVAGARKLRLDETPREELPVSDGAIEVDLGPAEILTLLLEPAASRGS